MQTREDIEAMGFTVHATTTFSDGVSYDARYGSRFMARGPKQKTPGLAMHALYAVCVARAAQKGVVV